MELEENLKARDQVKQSQQKKIINWSLKLPSWKIKNLKNNLIIIACSYAYIYQISIGDLHKPTQNIAWAILSSQYYRGNSLS